MHGVLALLAALAVSFSNPSDPAWSPDGGSLAFAGVVGDRSDVFVAGVDGSGLRNLTAGDPIGAHGLPAWSRDGRRLAYETRLGSYNAPRFGVSVVDRDGGNRVDVASSGAVGRPCFADARTLFFDDFEQVDAASIDRRAQRTIAIGAGFPVCSPRSARVAFLGPTPGGNSDVVTVSPDGSRRRRLTTAKGWDLPLAWSRDGRRVLFATEREEIGRKHPVGIALYVMGADGSRQRRVARARYGDISPDGRRVVYLGRRGLFVVGADGRGARRLVAGTRLFDPQWSPDGRWIAFTMSTATDAGLASTIELIHPDGTGRHTFAPFGTTP
jgi:Tol biopolymer transport system component